MRRGRQQFGTTTHSAAFTLLEIIVCIVILGLIATAIVPRVLNVGRRQADLEAGRVQRLLSVVAEKCSVWNEAVAVDYSADKSQLSVWTRRADTKAGADATGSARVKWEMDGLVEPVVLDRLRLAQAAQDGQILPGGKWRVAFIPGQPRPELTFQLEPKAEQDGPRWMVTLAPDQATAVRSAGEDSLHSGKLPMGAESRSIDLDDAGKGQTPW
jgi:prepilin-type N-terminal cleavage/methylation domain-containing protein